MREVYHHYIKYNCYDQKRNITKVIYTGCVADEGYFRNTSCVLHNIQFYHINDVYSVVNLCSCSCVLNTDYNGITQIAALYVSRQMKSMRPDLKRNSGNKGNTKIQETTTV